ncbi:MAG: TolB family protein, partial [Chloroflexota bacterium]
MILPHDPDIAAWLTDSADEGPPESLARALSATHQTRKRPRWAFPERWIPVQFTMAQTRGVRSMLATATVALLIVALVAAALVIGSHRRERPPFGPGRNGAIVYQQDGDLFIADQLGATPRPLVTGSETDSDPVFSPQGDRVAFIRDGARIMTVSLDGSEVRELSMPGTVVRLDW